jgi:molybdopterin molybdotransferase
MLPVDQAESIILDLVQPLQSPQDIETVDLCAALGRVLATPVISHLDFPHWDNSAMDGYAVRHADIKGSTANHPITLKIVEEIPHSEFLKTFRKYIERLKYCVRVKGDYFEHCMK